MSDMTDQEFLRRNAYGGESARYHAIADRLDAMQWRDELPDTEGRWVLRRGEIYVVLNFADLSKVPLVSLSGDRWLKLPEEKR